MPNEKVYEMVTEQVIGMLEAGTVPWRTPWRTAGMPRSMNGGRPYRGINPFLLNMTAMAHGYTSPFWATYKHAASLGGQVRKGERSTIVVFWKRGTRTVVDDAGNEKEKSWSTLRFFRVFNADQCDGLPEKFYGGVTYDDALTPSEATVAVIDEYTARGPGLVHGGDAAFYRPATDTVHLPPVAAFKSPEDYACTAFHELTHSTGHKSRLNRPGIVEHIQFASPNYAAEELVAEMGAAFLCAITGIEQVTLPQSAAYVSSWLGALRGDPKLVVTAAAAAQRAVDHILGVTFDAEATTTTESEAA